MDGKRYGQLRLFVAHMIYPYGKLPAYPHMRPQDVAIWERFIEKYPDAYDTCEYDVAVGEGPDFSPIVNHATGGSDHKLYQKKIDVIGHKGTHLDIIEVKPNAGLGAFGQVLSYEILYLEHIDANAATDCVILTDRLAPDMAHLADQHQVRIVVV